MTTADITSRIVTLSREGKFEHAQAELYAEQVLSEEPEGGAFKTVTTRQEVIETGRLFAASIEAIHSLTVSDPIVCGATFSLDADFKGSGRSLFEEVCAFKVQDGKIVKASYLY